MTAAGGLRRSRAAAARDGGRIDRRHARDVAADAARAWKWDDPAYEIVGGELQHSTTIYGPYFSLSSELHAHVAGTDPDIAAFLYRATAAVGVVLLIALLARHAPRPAFAVAFVGWNPLLALQFAGGGHNDVWMILFVPAGVLLARSGREVLAGASWVVGLAVTVAFLPLEVLARWRRERRELRRLVGGLFLGSLLVATVSTWRYGVDWTSTFGRTAGQLGSGELGVVAVSRRSARRTDRRRPGRRTHSSSSAMRGSCGKRGAAGRVWGSPRRWCLRRRPGSSRGTGSGRWLSPPPRKTRRRTSSQRP